MHTSERLLMLAARHTGRADLAEQSGVSEAQLLQCARLADLLQIPGIGATYGKLLWRAGIDSVAKLAKQDPQQLHRQLCALNAEERIVRRLPPEQELHTWAEAAGQADAWVRE